MRRFRIRIAYRPDAAEWAGNWYVQIRRSHPSVACVTSHTLSGAVLKGLRCFVFGWEHRLKEIPSSKHQ